MLRDYTRLYRAFSVIDPAPNDGTPCHWHRLDALRFLRHPSFALPSDIAYPAGAISVDPIPAGILITSSISPILFVEFRAAGAEHPIAVIEPGKIQYSVLLPTDTLIKDYKIDIFPISSNTETHSLGSTAELGRTQIRWDPALGTVYRTGIRGAGKARSIRTIIPMPLKRIRFYTGIAVDGMEFFSSTGDSALFGKRGGSAKDFELAEGEVLRGFAVRSGMWVDAVSVVTDRRKGPWLGGQGGGYGEALVPVGMTPVGLTGELADWVTGLGMEYVLFSNS